MRFAGPLFLGIAVLPALVGCRPSGERSLVSRSQTFAELRTIKRGVQVTPPGGDARREPYPRERLVDGESIEIEAGGLVWLRRDAGATLLVSGPASLTLRADTLDIRHGKLFVDTPLGSTTELTTPRGKLHLSAVRTSIEIDKQGALKAYVLRGAVRTDSGVQAGPGQELSVQGNGKPATRPVAVWQDWTGGLATTDRAAEPAPYGVGTVGARKPGEQGQPRFPLSIQRLDVRVKIDHDFASTEVDEVFANPSADTVEGIYFFRTPEGATLHRFGVDRGGELVWGRVKEKQAAAAQYQANVYQGSSEDPALLEWIAPGVFKARLYPIKEREVRRVVTRYAEWLPRQGPHGERRLYVYPMAAEGSEGTLPRIEELNITLDVENAGAKEVRVGMSGKQFGSKVVVKAYDFVPRADLAVELFDAGPSRIAGYRVEHAVDEDTTAADELDKAKRLAKGEAPYLVVPIRPTQVNEPAGGLDLAVVVDASAATDSAALAIARATTSALLAHLGPNDRAAVWAGDASLRAVSDDSARFLPVDAKRREDIVSGLARVERGGATDLGAIIADGAGQLDAGRRGAIVYIGDGLPTVGESAVPEIEKRLSRLPKPVPLFTVGVGDRANLALLAGIAQGGFSARVTDAHAAAETALRVLADADRPVWLGTSLELGPGVDRVYPRVLGALPANETALVIGRVVGAVPKEVVVKGSSGESKQGLDVQTLADDGDLQRRWAEGRLAQLMSEGAGRPEVVEVGSRSGIITPFTSLYVPTAAEHSRELERADESSADQQHWWNWLFPKKSRAEKEQEALAVALAAQEDNKEGGTGTRAKGEEGSMGNPTAKAASVAAAAPAAPAAAPSRAASKEALEFGMIGALNTGASGDPNAPAAPWGRDGSPTADESATQGVLKGGEIGEASGAGGLALGGDGLAAIGTLGRGAGVGTGQGFGAGAGRLGGAHQASAASVRMGAVSVTGRLPPEVVQRIVRQNFGRFRNCYAQGLGRNPNLEGRVATRFVIGGDGVVTSASNGGSDLPDSGVVSCVVSSFNGLTFPAPEGGVVTVVYPLLFAPGGGANSPKETAEKPAPAAKPGAPPLDQEAAFALAHLGRIGHTPAPCGASADLPLEDRRALWRERLANANSHAQTVKNIYLAALNGCEAQTWSERSELLYLAVNALVTIPDRVEFWREFLRSPSAADAIYRAILTRVHTAAEIRALHDALGLKQLDPTLLSKALAEKKTSEERERLLQSLVKQWPDDLELALALLDACDDAGDETNGRALSRRLRRRGDASTRVRTAVGEYYLRLSERGKPPAVERDATEARRTFGEIVEFAPDDPGARRLLGDLLRAHGWYEEALRQYETLARLAPDDRSVPLLLSAAAQGLGHTEEAIHWTEKAIGAGSPDPTNADARTARAFASAFLAWARDDAERGGRKDEATRLRERARRLTAVDVASPGTVRFILTWAHPELHPELWSNLLGSPMPVPDGDPALGVAQALLPGSLSDGFVELRFQAGDAERAVRLNAQATLTAILNEGSEQEKIAVLPVHFALVDGKLQLTRRFQYSADALREVAP